MLIKILPCIKGPLLASVRNCLNEAGCEITKDSSKADFVVGLAQSVFWSTVTPEKKIKIVNPDNPSEIDQGAVCVARGVLILHGSNTPLKDFLRVRTPLEGVPGVVAG